MKKVKPVGVMAVKKIGDQVIKKTLIPAVEVLSDRNPKLHLMGAAPAGPNNKGMKKRPFKKKPGMI